MSQTLTYRQQIELVETYNAEQRESLIRDLDDFGIDGEQRRLSMERHRINCVFGVAIMRIVQFEPLRVIEACRGSVDDHAGRPIEELVEEAAKCCGFKLGNAAAGAGVKPSPSITSTTSAP